MSPATDRLLTAADPSGRIQVVERVGYLVGGDSGPPALDLEFVAADEIVVAYRSQIVHRVTFDPDTFDVLQTECDAVDVGRALIGCEG